MKNLFFELLDVDLCKKLILETPEDEICILLPHYSINIQMRYNRFCKDPEQISFDWDEFEEAIGESMYVSDFDDLCVDPHNLVNF